jgi:hypothetical protein
MNLEQFATDGVRRMSELPDPLELFADVRAEVAASGLSDGELAAEIPAAVVEVVELRSGDDGGFPLQFRRVL